MNLKIMSYNILCYGPDEFDWEIRQPMVINLIKKEMPDSFGVQEAHYGWMQVLNNALEDYDYAGIGREGGTKGEFSAIFYLKDKFEALDSGTFWLAENPQKPAVLTGDFNFPEGCDLYKQMISGKFVDSKYATQNNMDHYTFNAFYPVYDRKDELEVIDYLNVTKEIKVNSYRVLTDRPDGNFPSDHFPVVAEIEI